MENIKQKLIESGFKGEMDDSISTLQFYSHDASLFEIMPKIVLFTKDNKDVITLVKVVAGEKKMNPKLSITARSAGTCMSGGAVNDSIIVDFTKHINQFEGIKGDEARVMPGMFYRDFEKETLKKNLLMPSYPASRDLAAVGGMVSNNSGGEKSLEYGKILNFVSELKVVLVDGNEYVMRPISKTQLDVKMKEKTFEGKLYKDIFELADKNYDLIKNARPKVSKNSMGYNIWDVWDRDKQVFDLTKLIVGSQGTLGMVTDIKLKLVENKKHSGILVLFMKNLDDLGEVIPKVLEHKPATFESFDDQTLLLSIRFMPSFLKLLGVKKFINLLINLIPDGLQLLRGIPKLILMVEFNGNTEEEVRDKIKELHRDLKKYKARYEINGFEEDPTEARSEKFWVMRRQSFNLLRSKVKDKHTAPFIDDLVVNPEYLTEFLPKLRKIINKYKLFATIAGHMGDGNFHIIPLMKLEDPKDRAKLLPAMKEVNKLILKYHGSLSGEHNDGLIRGPWLKEQFGDDMLMVFKQVKNTFDPENIFNPHKKSDAKWDYSFSHIREHF